MVLVPGAAQAQSDVPDLVGTWVSTTGEIGHWSGEIQPFEGPLGALTVAEQVGGGVDPKPQTPGWPWVGGVCGSVNAITLDVI